MATSRRISNRNGRCPKRSRDVVWKQVTDRGILLDLRSGAYFEVDPVGLAIWKRCDGGRSSEAIAATIARRFGVKRDRAFSDLRPFLGQLRRLRLVS